MRPSLWTAPLLAIALGCAHVPPTSSSDAVNDPSALSYRLELVRSPFTVVKVTLEAAGAPDGKTVFDAGEEWGGIERPEDEVHGLAVLDSAGRGLPVEHPAGHTWIVQHAPGERLTLSYYLVSTRYDLTTSSETYYRAVVRESLVHLVGETSLVFPTHLDDQTKRRIGLRWVGFADAGWKTVSSFGADEAFTVSETVSAFRHAVFIASSDLRLVPRTVKGNTLMLGIVGEWPFADGEMADLASSIVEAQRTFFDDPGPSFFLISVIPVGEYQPEWSSTGGTGLTHSFATFLSPRLPLTGEMGDRVKWLLGHELFHAWNGGTIRPQEPGPLVYWLTEGFTNFYTRRLLYRAGLISLEAFVADLNEAVDGYYLSPVRNEPNTRILADFWSSEAVQKLPYRRGDMVALLLDREIKRVSDGGRSLDDFMRALVAEARASGERVTTETILARIEKETSKEFAARIAAAVNEGASLELDPSGLGPCVSGEIKQVGQFDLGFDFAQSKQGKRVVGVVPGSNAYLAGLRDGQTLTGWSIHAGNPEEQAELKVRDGSEEKKIRYLPQGAPVPVPSFRVGDAGACAPQSL